MLIKAFKGFGDEFIEESHVAPLRELGSFCTYNLLYSGCSSGLSKQETLRMLPPFGKHIDDVTRGLSELIESTIPKILRAKETAQSIKCSNMLTAATFFSAVTASALQLSYAYNTNPHASFGVAVNTLWFVALVFSTASGLSSLVGLMWYQK
ncbi:hypothetical protein M0805_005574 [Coniferiporia weirii]|nr:hypothetical protein M0805_005574 [Coniferiporia weirii]